MRNVLFFFSLVISFLTSANTDFDKGVHVANQNQLDSAVILFEKVIAKEPQNASAYYNLGYCYFQQKQYGEAIWAFEKSLQYDPKNSNAIKNLEICHFKLGLPPYTSIDSGLMRSLFSVGADNWSFVVIAFSILISLVLVLFVLTTSVNLKRISLIALFLFLCLGITAFILGSKTNSAFYKSCNAIVTAKEIPTYLTTSGEKSPITLPEGTRLTEITSVNKHYYHGNLINGQEVMIDNMNWKKL